MTRIHLSPPDVGRAERDALLDAFDSGWIAPVGPELVRFEHDVAARLGLPHAVALSSGTAALHLALRLAGVGPGDEVVVPTLTFIATAAAATYQGAQLTFVDADPTSWCIDASLVEQLLDERALQGRLPRAVVTVDLYGLCPDYARITAACANHGVALIEDAAEALGTTVDGRPAGSFGQSSVLSFNGNKIITTSGGGMLLSDDGELIDRALHLATQAREPAAHYEHEEVGYNYRLSNLLAALGRAQLAGLDERIASRRATRARYTQAFADLDSIGVLYDPEGQQSNAWLTVITLDPAATSVTPTDVRLALEADDIEARPAWKPLHLQPAFRDVEVVGGAAAERVFSTALCLPSGSNLSTADQDRVIEIVRATVLGTSA